MSTLMLLRVVGSLLKDVVHMYNDNVELGVRILVTTACSEDLLFVSASEEDAKYPMRKESPL